MAILAAGLLCAGGGATLLHAEQSGNAEPAPVPAAGVDGPRQEPQPPSWGDNAPMPGFRGRMVMKEMLQLSAQQEAKVNDMRRRHAQENMEERRDLFRLKRELATESMQKRPDDKKISALAEKIGQKHVRLATNESRHLRELASVLDRKQIETLLRLKGGPDEWRGRGRGWAPNCPY